MDDEAVFGPGIGDWLDQSAGTLAQVGAALVTTDGAAIYSYQQPTKDAATDPEGAGIRRFWRELASSVWST